MSGNYEVASDGSAKQILFSGGDALLGNTRPHPEHDGKDESGR